MADSKSVETRQKPEIWQFDNWGNPFSDITPSELASAIIRRDKTLPSGEKVTFFLHDLPDMPKQVITESKSKSLVVVIEPTKQNPYNVQARTRDFAPTIAVGIPDSGSEEMKTIYEEWAKERPDRDDKANPFLVKEREVPLLQVTVQEPPKLR